MGPTLYKSISHTKKRQIINRWPITWQSIKMYQVRSGSKFEFHFCWLTPRVSFKWDALLRGTVGSSHALSSPPDGKDKDCCISRELGIYAGVHYS